MRIALMMWAALDSTPCVDALERLHLATIENYGPYHLLSQAQQRRVGKLKDVLRGDARGVRSLRACQSTLDAYLGQFRDPHLYVDAAWPEAPRIQLPSRHVLAQRLQHDAGTGTGISGRWYDAEGSIAIVQDPAHPGRFLAIRQPQHRLFAVLEHDRQQWSIVWTDGALWRQQPAALRRDGQLLAYGVRGMARAGANGFDPKDPLAPHYQRMTDRIGLLSLPSFMPQYAASLRAIVDRHGSEWTKLQGLIVDLRGNAGGDAIYVPLAPWILDGPIELERATNLLVSPAAQRHLQSALADDKLNARMAAQPGQIIEYREPSTVALPAYQPRPLRIVLLQDAGVGSAAEAFVRQATQSARVVSIGAATRGNIDTMQTLSIELGKGPWRFRFGFPLYFDRALPEQAVNHAGIAPQLPLALPEHRWIAFAVHWITAVDEPALAAGRAARPR